MTAIDIITARIRRYSDLIDELEQVRRELLQAGEVAEREPQHELPPAEAPAAGKEGPPAGGRREQQTTRRRAIAELLSAGPLGRAEIGRRLSLPAGGVYQLLAHPWFEKSGPGLRDPFRLTAAGRAALGADREPTA